LTGQTAVEAVGVSKVFHSAGQDVRALDDVSVAIRKNEFFTLLGPSGCGKTTLLRMIAGFEAPTAGTILLDGADITDKPPFRRPVNTVFQSYALFPHLTVAQNIAFGLEMLSRPKSEVEEAVARTLALVQMEGMAGRKPGQLSGGQQQRVALARALAPRPSVLLLDEPLSALDFKLRKEMQVELKRLQTETGITFIFVTHDQEEALTMSDRIGVMSSGNILQIGSPREIYNHPANRFVADFIGESNFLDGVVKSISTDAATIQLPGGHITEVSTEATLAPNAKVTLAIRPEHIQVKPAGSEAALPATIANLVYFGTDTHCYLDIDGGGTVVARLQNSLSGEVGLNTGTKVGVAIAPGAAQILRD